MNTNYTNEELEYPQIEEEDIQYYEDGENQNCSHLQNEGKENYNEIESNNKHFLHQQNVSDPKDRVNLNSDSGEPIYVMTLELDQNNFSNIKIYSDSVPFELAYEFCKENNLDYKSLNFLAGEIENLMTNYKSKISNDVNKFVTNQNDEIIELEEEQITTEKNRNPEERELERDNLNYLNLVDREEKQNSNENKNAFDLKHSQKSTPHRVDRIPKNFEEDEGNFKDYLLLDLDENEKIKNDNFVDGCNNSNQEINLDINQENFKYNNQIEDQDDVVEEVSNIVCEKLDELNKSTREIQEKYDEEKYLGLSTPEPEKLATHETPQNQNQNSLKNSIRASRRANQPEENNVSNNYNSGTDFNQTNTNNNNQQLGQTKNLSSNENNNPQYKSVMFSYPSNSNTNTNKYDFTINRSKSVNKLISKKPNIFDRLFREAQLKRILPKHGRSYRSYYSELEKSDKSNQLNTNQGQLIYYKEKVLKEEKFRKFSKSKTENLGNTIERNFSTMNSKSNNNLFTSKTPTHASKYYINSFSNYNTGDLNKTIHKRPELSKNLQYQNEEKNTDRSNVNTSSRENYIEKESENIIKRNHSCSVKMNNDFQLHQNPNSNFAITKFIPYKNLFENEEKQKFKKILTIQKIRNQTESSFTFKPIVHNKYQCDLNFLQRQEIYQENSKRRTKEIDEILKNPTDEKGKFLFHPNLITNPKQNHFLNSNYSFKNVFEKNYDYANKYQINKENLKKRFDSEHKKITIQNFESEEIFEKLKEEAFRNLFHELDNDQDDLITSINIGLNYIPSEIRKIINPILIELKEENESLNENEFIKAMSLLFEMLNYNDRQILIQKYKNRRITARANKNRNENDNSFGFKPTINENSNKLAEKYDRKLIQSMSQQNLIRPVRILNNNLNAQSYFRLGLIDKSKAMENIRDVTYQNFKRLCY